MTDPSILDLASIRHGSTPAEALGNSFRLAPQVERLRSRRCWLAEPHDMRIAIAATARMISCMAGGRKIIRAGAFPSADAAA